LLMDFMKVYEIRFRWVHQDSRQRDLVAEILQHVLSSKLTGVF
jgi:hypothetical protein